MRNFLFLFIFVTYHFCSGGVGDAPLKFLHRPANQEKAPVIILLHGYGSNEADLFSIQMMPECHVFSLRGPYAHPNVGYAWFSLQFKGRGELDYNYDQAKESRKKILRFISWACKKYNADSTRVVVIGFSQGAMMCYDLALQAGKKIAGIAALSGGIIPGSKNAIAAGIKGMPVFVAHGSSDDVIEFRYSSDARDFLNKHGAKVSFKSYNHRHNISGAEIVDLTAWIKTTILKN